MGVSDEPRRGARRPRAQIAGAGRLEKQLGSLPVIADFSRRLDIAGIVDRACPMRDVGPLSHGQVIEALIANRLTSPKAMVAVADWAQAWAVDEVYGIDPDTLNDDRLGRALDVLAGQVDQVVGSIGAKAIEAFGIDVTRLHWDMTSISLYGAYRDTDDDYPAAAFGHPKDRRTDLKQIQAGLAVTADGAIPVFARAYDGNAAEISQVTDTMYALQALAASRSFLLVGDSKLISYANVTAMHDAQVTFIAPLAAARVPEGLFVSLDRAQATFVDYVADRDEDKRFSDRDSYRVCEDTMDLAGPRKKDPVLTLRRILVYSTANATAQAKARQLRHTQARTDLDTLTRTAGTRHHPTIEAVTAKATAIARRPRRHRGVPTLQGPTDGRTPLRRVQRTTRRRTDLPTRQPTNHRPDHRHLPGPAHLLPHRTRSPPQPRPRHRNTRLLHQRPPPPQTHRTPHPPSTRRPPPHPRTPGTSSHHPQTRIPPDPTPGTTPRRPHSTPLAMTDGHSTACANDGASDGSGG